MVFQKYVITSSTFIEDDEKREPQHDVTHEIIESLLIQSSYQAINHDQSTHMNVNKGSVFKCNVQQK